MDNAPDVAYLDFLKQHNLFEFPTKWIINTWYFIISIICKIDHIWETWIGHLQDFRLSMIQTYQDFHIFPDFPLKKSEISKPKTTFISLKNE